MQLCSLYYVAAEVSKFPKTNSSIRSSSATKRLYEDFQFGDDNLYPGARFSKGEVDGILSLQKVAIAFTTVLSYFAYLTFTGFVKLIYFPIFVTIDFEKTTHDSINYLQYIQ